MLRIFGQIKTKIPTIIAKTAETVRLMFTIEYRSNGCLYTFGVWIVGGVY